MMSPLGSDNRLPRLVLLSRVALAWEKLWPALWPVLFVVGVFAVVALFDLLSWLPGPAHVATLAGFVIALAGAAVWGVRRLVWPDMVTARRRIEVKSGLDHRPLAALADHPSEPLDDAAAGLWEAHRRRVSAMVRGLRVGWPVAGLARHDPWGLRAILAILLVVAAIDAGADWRARLTHALTPSWDGRTPGVAASFDIWITPPDYTGLAPQFLRADTAGTIRVPTGSKLLAQIHGSGSVPRLLIDDAASDFQALDKNNFRAETTLTQGKSLSVSQGGTVLGQWPIEIIPDNPPVAAFAEPPKPTLHAALHLAYRASDDYGVEGVKAVITRADGNSTDKIEIEMPLPGLHLKEAHGATYQDLSPHPWAGLPVDIRIVATDALGQTGESEPVHMTLPERDFRNPVARAIVDQRKELVKDPGSDEAVAEILDDLNLRPKLYRDDTVVYMALQLAALRLREPDTDAAIAAVIPLLWDTALRIEDSGMSVAERDLRRLQQELQDALARGAPDEEIDRLMREMQQALAQYLQSLAQNMERNGDQTAQPTDPSHTLTGRDLQRMLDRARELAHSGAQQQARELLSQLQDMLENLRMARPGDAQQRGPNQAGQMMRGLQDMMQRQQQLLDRSFRAQRQMNGGPGQNGQQPGDDDGSQTGDLGSAAGQQEDLRRALGEIMRRLGSGAGNIPDALGRAERAMRDATGALQRGDPGAAIGAQTDALDQLQEGAREFAQQLRDQMQNGWEAQGDDPNGYGQEDPGMGNRDPFGRPMSSNNLFDQGDVQIPDASILQKSREILDELRRRAGERARPMIELDYIERLLKRF
jgi:uncharacterized protein (TIGR02302 family)